MREQIEKRAQEGIIKQIYKDVFKLLKTMIGSKSQANIIEKFDKNFVKKGKFPLIL